MALSVKINNEEGVHTLQALKNRNFGIVTGSIAFDSSYPTGGEEETSIYTKFSNLLMVLFEMKAGYTFAYDYNNHKVLAYYGDYSSTNNGPLIEVPNNTDLSALSDVRFVAFGWI